MLMNHVFSQETLDLIKTRLPKEIAEKLPDTFEEFVVHYVDDLFIFSKNQEDHIYHLYAVFEAIRYAGLKMSPKKCKVYCDQMKILGVNMFPSEGELSLDRAKATAFLN